MTVPHGIREEVRDRLWAEADRLDWSNRTAADKSRYYTIWTETAGLGGRLSTFMDPRHVRVYIKDTLLKGYTRQALSDHSRPYRVLGIDDKDQAKRVFIKPHGRLLSDGRQIAWSRASDWKATLMALHERAHEEGRPFGVVLLEAGAKFSTADSRAVVESAAQKLSIQHTIWLD